MNEFLEFDEAKKTIKELNLDNFYLEDLDFYISELKNQLKRG